MDLVSLFRLVEAQYRRGTVGVPTNDNGHDVEICLTTPDADHQDGTWQPTANGWTAGTRFIVPTRNNG